VGHHAASAQVSTERCVAFGHQFLNVKPALRHGKSKEFWTKLMAAEIYAGLTPVAQPP